jgi:hypothetical protein
MAEEMDAAYRYDQIEHRNRSAISLPASINRFVGHFN